MATSTKKKTKRKAKSLSARLKSFTSNIRVRFAKTFKWVAITIAVLCIAPFVLTVLYRFEAIKPPSTLMVGKLVTFQTVRRDWVEFDTIAPALYQSVLMSEDGKFCSHSGVDWDAVNIVITDALDGERPRGASTITMQTAKNLFLWGGRSYLRKVLEVPLALWIDLILPKKRIMEIYLNIAEWDDGGIYGIEAGAQSHFSRSASKLTRRQSALMAVTLPNPILREPSKPNAGLNRLARTIEARAKQSGAYIKCLK